MKDKEYDEPKITFRNASGEPMHSEGKFEQNIYLQQKHKYKFGFHVIKNLTEPIILGLDFITENHIKFNGKNRKITYPKGSIKHEIIAFIDIIPEQDVLSIQVDDKIPEDQKIAIDKLIDRNKDLIATKMTEIGRAVKVKHHINTTEGPPIRIRPYRMARSLMPIAKQMLEEMLLGGVIRPSSSPYSSPMLLVPKPTGAKRLCIDYRQLNKRTIKDSFPLPRIDETIDELAGSKFRSTVDLYNGFWQIEIAEEDKHKTAFTSPLGHFEWNRLPFGLNHSPATFQRALNDVLRPVLNKFAMVYLDDIIIYSKTFDEHLQHLNIVFELLRNAGFKIRLDKCKFIKEKMKYLGFIVSNEGISPDPKGIQPILNYKAPKNIDQLRSFLGMAGYYRKFVQNFADIAHPLTALTKKETAWKWGPEQEKAFQTLKTRLTTPPILRYPDFTREFTIQTDASGYGVGAVLAQKQLVNGKEEEVAIAYASKHLTESELKWSTIEKEAFAIVFAIKTFYPYVYGQQFTILTDHKPLEYLKNIKEHTGKLARWAMLLEEYDINIVYRPGPKNNNADFLSRIPPPADSERDLQPQQETIKLSVNLVTKDFKEAQEQDKFSQDLRRCIENSANSENSDPLTQEDEPDHRLPGSHKGIRKQSIQEEEHPDDDHSDSGDDDCPVEIPTPPYVILPNGLIGSPDGKLLVPEKLRSQVLDRFHNHKLAGHLGIRKTLARIRKRFIWPKMTKDIKQYVRKCLICAKRKSHGGSKAPLQPIPPPQRLWQTIAMDIVGPITTSVNGNNYVLVIVEYLTRYVFAVAIPDQTAETVAKAFINTIILEHGVPEVLITDQGTNFRSKLMETLCKQLGIKQIQTTAYHPQTDGSAESHNKTLMDIIACYVEKEPLKWDEYLKFATFSYNTSEHASLEETPFYLLYGRDAREPSDPLEPPRFKLATDENTIFAQQWKQAQSLAREKLQEAQEKQKQYYDRNAKETSYEIGEQVLLKQRPNLPGKFNMRWTGPFKVISKTKNPLNYRIQHVHDKNEIVTHVNRMKKLAPDEEPSPHSKKEKSRDSLPKEKEPEKVIPPVPTKASPPRRYGLRAPEHIKVPKRFME